MKIAQTATAASSLENILERNQVWTLNLISKNLIKCLEALENNVAKKIC